MNHKPAQGSIYVVADANGRIHWYTAQKRRGDSWNAFRDEIRYAAPKDRRAAINKAKLNGWRCVRVWAGEVGVRVSEFET